MLIQAVPKAVKWDKEEGLWFNALPRAHYVVDNIDSSWFQLETFEDYTKGHQQCKFLYLMTLDCTRSTIRTLPEG